MSTSASHVLSAQEQAIEAGTKVVHGTATDRVLSLLEAIRAYGQPRVALERAIYFTESFKATEGQPLVLRWAKALKHVAENISVTIFDDELIVGRPNTWLGRYRLVYPELDGSIMKAGAEAFMANKGARDAIAVEEEDKKIIDEVLFPYWNGKDFTPNFVNALPPESRLISFGPDPNNIGIMQTFVVLSSSTMRHSQNWVIDFGKMISRGCKGIREEARARLAELEHPRDLVHKKPFYEAVAAPLCSMLHDLCMEHGRDIHTHGEYFSGALDACCIDGVGGFATAIDSLAAIKHLIYDTRKLTWDQLLDALEKNWEGKEAIRQMCLNAPKYGNGIEWVDRIGYEIQQARLLRRCSAVLKGNRAVKAHYRILDFRNRPPLLKL